VKKRKSALSRLTQYEEQSDGMNSDKSEVQESLTESPVVPVINKPAKKSKGAPPLSKLVNVSADEDASESVDSKCEDAAEQTAVYSEPITEEQSYTKRKRKKRPKKAPVFSAVTSKERPLDKVVDSDDTYPSTEEKNEVNEDVLDVEYMVNQDKEEKREKRNALLKRIVAIMLIIGCAYMIFLIYGVFNTTYIYNDKGEIVPQKMTVKQIREMEQYTEITTQYRIARMLYEKVLTLDYRIAAGVEDPKLIAPEYESILEDVESLAIEIQAMEVPAKYSQVKNMLSTWIQTDVAVYCQRMSQAISQDNAEYAQQAMQYRTVMYDDFSLITENIVIIGQTVESVDIKDIIEWSPDKYVRENLGAID